MLVRLISVLVIVPLLFSCVSSENNPGQNQVDSPSLAGRMQGFSVLVERLIGDLYDPASFASIQDERRRRQDIAALSAMAHTVADDSELYAKEPSFRILAERLESETEWALQAFDSGHKEYARQTLQRAVSTCLQCHTRTLQGRVGHMNISEATFARLPLIARGELKAALRDVDGALETYTQVLAAQEVGVFDREKAARDALALAVIRKDDPLAVLELVKALESAPQLSHFLRARLPEWRREALDWQRERRSGTRERAVREGAPEKRLATLRRRDLNLQDASDVQRLRVEGNLLRIVEDPAASDGVRAEAFFLMGRLEGRMNDLSTLPLEEGYFVSCIELSGAGELAQACYTALEENLFFRYSGSAGVFMPAFERERLRRLHAIAFGRDN